MKVTQHSRNQQSVDIIPIRRKQNTESSHGEEGKEGEKGEKEDEVEEVVFEGLCCPEALANAGASSLSPRF
jgi:hypothetical protein